MGNPARETGFPRQRPRRAKAVLLALGYGLSLWCYLPSSRPQDRLVFVVVLTVPVALLAWLLWRGRASGLRTAAIVLLVLFALAAPFAVFVNHGLRSVMCQRQLLEMQVAMDMYVEGYGAFPPAAGWADALEAEGRVAWSLACPEPDWRTHGYAFNAALGGLRRDALADPSRVVLFFETEHGKRNAVGGPEVVPRQPRHRVGNYFVSAELGAFPHAFLPGREAGKLSWRPELRKPTNGIPARGKSSP